MRHSLEEIRAHGSFPAIALQAAYALVRSFLARVEVLAVRLAIVTPSALLQCAMLSDVWERWVGVLVEL